MFKLLIVDDEIDIREIAAKSFREKYGLEVFTAAEGKKALDLIIQVKPDLVLLDINMRHGMDGIDVLRTLKEMNLFVKVVIVSGYLTDEYLKQAHELGALDFVHKPFKLMDLEKVVFKYLNKP